MASVYDIHTPHLTVECLGYMYARINSKRIKGSDLSNISVLCQSRILNYRSSGFGNDEKSQQSICITSLRTTAILC